MLVLALLLIACLGAFPLVRNWYRAGSKKIEVRNESWGLSVFTLIATLFGIFILTQFWNVYGEYLWLAEELGAAERFWKLFFYNWLMFLIPAAISGSVMYLALRGILQSPEYKFMVAAAVIATASICGAVGLHHVDVVLLYNNHVAMAPIDPIFSLPHTFYMMKLPFYYFVVQMLFWVVTSAFLLAVFTPLIENGSRDRQNKESSRKLHDAMYPRLAAMLALWFVSFALLQWLAPYNLMVADHAVVHGVNYTNAHGNIFGYRINATISLILGIVCLVFRYMEPESSAARREDEAAGAYILVVPPVLCCITSAIFLAVVPYLVWYSSVRPNPLAAEKTYIEHTIAGTRQAFNLTAHNLQEEEFTLTDGLSQEDLLANQSTIKNVRVWDLRVLQQIAMQKQTLREMYQFADLDVDRYCFGETGECQQVMIGIRELAYDHLHDNAKNWPNKHLVYTHGKGLVMVPVNRYMQDGAPEYFVQDVPTQVNVPWLSIPQDNWYFGDLEKHHVYVNTKQLEFDYSAERGSATTHYSGTGGVLINSMWRKLTYAWKFDSQILIGSYMTPKSRIMFHRQIRERVQKLAPFLATDLDWYPVFVDGKAIAVLDAYTTSQSYPYAEAMSSEKIGRTFNYVRNSVKATVDMYNGTVTLYVFDQNDPIIVAYERAFPGPFKPASEMPANLRKHIRYAEDLFVAQHVMYGKYHVQSAEELFNGSDRWTVPNEYHHDQEVAMEPYYITAQLPGHEKPEFMLMRMFSFASKDKPRMTGWMAGLSDGDNYGKLVAYRFAKNHFVFGPAQIDRQIQQYEAFQQDFRNWKQGETSVIQGNMIILPLPGGKLVGFEPIYRTTRGSAIPTLARIVGFILSNDKIQIAWGRTMEELQHELVKGTGHQSVTVALPKTTEKLGAENVIIRVRELLNQYLTLMGEGKVTDAAQAFEAAKALVAGE